MALCAAYVETYDPLGEAPLGRSLVLLYTSATQYRAILHYYKLYDPERTRDPKQSGAGGDGGKDKDLGGEERPSRTEALARGGRLARESTRNRRPSR